MTTAFEHSDHCVSLCPPKTDKASALVGHKSTIGFATPAAATEGTKVANKLKKANAKMRKREEEGERPSNESSRHEKATGVDGRGWSYGNKASTKAWSGNSSQASGEGGNNRNDKSDKRAPRV